MEKTKTAADLRAEAISAEAGTVRLMYEGRELVVPAGISVAAAVLGHAHAQSTGVHDVDGSPRAPWCLMGVCFECLMEIDGEPNVQSCLVEVRDGMVVRRGTGLSPENPEGQMLPADKAKENGTQDKDGKADDDWADDGVSDNGASNVGESNARGGRS